jgi:hypothetical protein
MMDGDVFQFLAFKDFQEKNAEAVIFWLHEKSLSTTKITK